MIDYIIAKEEYLEYESEIVLSGCIPELIIPKVYTEGNLIFWVYDTDESEDIKNDYNKENIEYILGKTKSYMLNPKNIIFYPKRIYYIDGIWRYHYIPTKRRILYSSEDLKRYLIFNPSIQERKGNLKHKKTIKDSFHALYFKNNERIEPLVLRNTKIGSDGKCNIVIDFRGSVVISHQSELKIERGSVKVNQILYSENRSVFLKSGDCILFGNTEAVFI